MIASTKTTMDAHQEAVDTRILDTMRISKSKNLLRMQKQLVIPSMTKQVLFYSRFESGNLLRAVRKTRVKSEFTLLGILPPVPNQIQFEYDLYLEPDTNSDGHMHWFYFMTIAQNFHRGERIRFNIRNHVRIRSLYQEGMLPRIKFCNHSQDKGWHIDPNVTVDLKYCITDQKENFDKQFYYKQTSYGTFSFTYEVQVDNEEICFAYDTPYTYSDNFIPFYRSFVDNPDYKKILQVS